MIRAWHVFRGGIFRERAGLWMMRRRPGCCPARSGGVVRRYVTGRIFNMIQSLHWPVPAWRRGALTAVAIALAAVAAGPAAPAAAAVGWGIQATSSPSQLNELIAVSCSSAIA